VIAGAVESTVRAQSGSSFFFVGRLGPELFGAYPTEVMCHCDVVVSSGPPRRT
jgi:hypothetical protein